MTTSGQKEDPIASFERIVNTLRRQDASLYRQIAARTLNNLLFLVAKSGGAAELNENHIEMYLERLAQDFHTIHQLGHGHGEFVPKPHIVEPVGEAQKAANG